MQQKKDSNLDATEEGPYKDIKPIAIALITQTECFRSTFNAL